MTSALLSPWQFVLRIGLLSSVAGTLVIACDSDGVRSKPKLLAAPYLHLPAGCAADTIPSTTTRLQACLQGLVFDTTETVGDEQRLMVRTSGTGPRCIGDSTHACRYGPLAKVEPVMGSHTYTDSALGQGRIIARMFIRNGETEGYDKFGLVPGDTTYWWVHTGKDSSFFVHSVSEDSNLVVVGRPLEQTPHEEGSFQQALARWIWDPNDERANGTCGSNCCK